MHSRLILYAALRTCRYTNIHIHHPAYYTFLNIYIYMLMTVGCGPVEGADGARHPVGGARGVRGLRGLCRYMYGCVYILYAIICIRYI